MEDARQVLVGIELKEDITQISVYQYSNVNSTKITVPVDLEEPIIPTCLFFDETEKKWIIGNRAYNIHQETEGIYLEHFLSIREQKDVLTIGDKELSYCYILSIFFKELLTNLRNEFPNQKIAKLVIVLENTETKWCEKVYDALKPLGLFRDRVVIISPLQSFMYYMLSQDKNLFVNDVDLVELCNKGCYYHRLTMNRKVSPIPVLIHTTDLSNELSMELFHSQGEVWFINKFETIMNQMLYKRLVSSLFFTGSGFRTAWADPSLQKLCIGRRVFKGQNLYVKGASYAAKALIEGTLSNYILFDKESINSTVTIRVYHNAVEENLELIKLGTDYRMAQASIEVILDNTSQIELTITNILQREPHREILKIDGLSTRENKTIRLSIQIRCLSCEQAVLTIRDIGFGEFYPMNYRIWEQILEIG